MENGMKQVKWVLQAVLEYLSLSVITQNLLNGFHFTPE